MWGDNRYINKQKKVELIEENSAKDVLPYLGAEPTKLAISNKPALFTS